ncbi:hypothetical protein SAMN04488535_1308 [Corynebacterium mycetoides]|uniref:Sortase family protein n=1 Tax=Corynebacterium mycetoides TaxID=38302 RepID=A0A1G9P4A0_9CORY|nr:hypothetical protein [Corynebacterium mycetoides]SDL93606.1 hypothetical protein SAMN04488535_1308 [Corynebacterium mycetoides]
MSTTARRVHPPHIYMRRRVAAAALLLLPLAAVGMCAAPGDEPEAPTPVAPVEEVVPQGRPVALEVPSISMRAEFEPGDCRVKNGALNPATMGLACAYTAPGRPYQLPGSHAGDLVVIAGHTGAGLPGVFDSLFDAQAGAHTVQLGDALYLRTETSGDAWLKYVATDLHEPTKDALAQDPAVWGTGPMPGRLLTISCIQPLLSDSVRNAVVGWQFEAVVASVG